LSAEQWEARLAREALRLNDANFAEQYAADPQAQAVLAQIQNSGGPRMDWRGTSEYQNAAINAQYLAQNANTYLRAGPLAGDVNPTIDPLTYAYSQAAYDPNFRNLPAQEQQRIVGQLIVYGEALQGNPNANAVQRAAADTATRNAAAQARESGALPETFRTPADQRMGQSTSEHFIGAAIAGRPSTATRGDTATEAPPKANEASPPSPPAGTDPLTAVDADFAGQIPVRPRDGRVSEGTPVTETPLARHLIEANVSSNGKLVEGGHNMSNFDAAVTGAGGSVTSRREVAPGIWELTYQLPGGKEQPKTVYDPARYSDTQMANMANEAAARGLMQYQVTGNREQVVVVNGVTFFVPIRVPGKNVGPASPAQPYVPTAYPIDPSKAPKK
jgi:hypothetical protein